MLRCVKMLMVAIRSTGRGDNMSLSRVGASTWLSGGTR